MSTPDDSERYEYPDAAGYPDGAGTLDEGTAALVDEVTADALRDVDTPSEDADAEIAVHRHDDRGVYAATLGGREIATVRYDLDGELGQTAGAVVLADRHPIRLRDRIRRRVDLLEFLFAAPDANAAPEFPVDPVVAEFVTAVAFHDPAGIVLFTDDVEMVVQSEENLVRPRGPFL